MERGILIQHLEAVDLCEESSTNVDGNKVILDVHPMTNGEKKKVEKPSTNANKLRKKECQYYKKSNHQEKCFGTFIT
jgi:hypothetical protein